MASGALAASLTGQRATARQREEERKEARAADTREVYRRDQRAAAQQRDQCALSQLRQDAVRERSQSPSSRQARQPATRQPATSQPSPDDALAQVNAVVARARSAQRAANLAQQSPCFASARAAHTALVAVGRALAVASASYSRIEGLRLDLELAAHGGTGGPAPVRKRQRTSDRLRATQSPEAQELAAHEPVPPSQDRHVT